MDESLPIHTFDPSKAASYRPRADFVKTAILVPVADPAARTTLAAPFGEEVMEGDFYIVASENGPYGAARAEFEAAHTEVEPNRWVKSTPVLAYRANERCVIETHLADGIHETTVIADAGDWIFRQATGEVMTTPPATFAERYELAADPSYLPPE